MAQVAREGLKQAEIPNLLVTEKYPNIVDFIEKTYKSHLAINKNSPQHIGAFLDTMKQKCGPLKEAVQYLQTLPEIYRTISNVYMQGIDGIMRLFSYNRIKSETALDSYKSVKNISEFERMAKVAQRLEIQKNMNNTVLSSNINWMFLSEDIDNFWAFRAKNTKFDDRSRR